MNERFFKKVIKTISIGMLNKLDDVYVSPDSE